MTRILSNTIRSSNVKKLAMCFALDILLSLCAVAAHANDAVSFATGGYASASRAEAPTEEADTVQEHTVSRKEWLARQNEVFSMMDQDKTGEVDASEFMSAYPETIMFATGGYAAGLPLSEIFRRIDTNGDGRISRQEFLAYELEAFETTHTGHTQTWIVWSGQYFASGGEPAP
jgi:hypothetical protein